MTGLLAGYVVSSVAILIAASAALTIIRGVGRLDSTAPDRLPQERPDRAAA